MEFFRSSMECLEREMHPELQCDLDEFRLLEPNSELSLQLDVAAQIEECPEQAPTPASQPPEESRSDHSIASSSLYTHQTLAEEQIPDVAQTGQPWSGFQTNPLVVAEVNQGPLVMDSIIEPSQQQYLILAVNEDSISSQQPISFVVPGNQYRQVTVQVDTVLPRNRERKFFSKEQLSQLLRHFEANQRPNEFAMAMIAQEIDDSVDRVARWFINRRMRQKNRSKND